MEMEEHTSTTSRIGELELEVRRLRGTYSFQLGLLLTESFARKPWLLPLLPFRAISMTMRYIGGQLKKTKVAQEDRFQRIDADCLMLVEMNRGSQNSLQNLQLITDIWLQKPGSKIIVVTTDDELTSQLNSRCSTYLLPDPKADEGISRRSWNISCDNLVGTLIDLHRPIAIAFDGTYPYRGLLDAIKRWQAIHSIWLKDRDSISDSVLNEKAAEFDSVIEMPRSLIQSRSKSDELNGAADGTMRFLIHGLKRDESVAEALKVVSNNSLQVHDSLQFNLSKENEDDWSDLIELEVWDGEVDNLSSAGFTGVITGSDSALLHKLMSNGIYTVCILDDDSDVESVQNAIEYSMRGGLTLLKEPDGLELEMILTTIADDTMNEITNIGKREQLLRFLVPNGFREIEKSLSSIPKSERIELTKKAFNENNWAESLFHVESIIQSDPSNYWGLEMRAIILINQKSWYNSIPAWERLLRMRQKDSEPHIQIARAHSNIGNGRLALFSCMKALALSNQSDDANAIMVKIFNESGPLLVDDVKEVEKLRDSTPLKHPTHLILMLLVDDSEQALKVCESALEENPDDISMSEHRIELLTEIGRVDDSLLALGEYLERFSDDLEKIRTALKRLSTSGHSSAALSLAEKIFTQIPNDKEARIVCARMLMANDPAASLKHLSRLNRDDLVTLLSMQAERQAGRPEQADILFRDYNGNDLAVLFEAVRIVWSIGDLESTVERANAVLSLNPKHFGAGKFKTDALVRLGVDGRYRKHLLDFSTTHSNRIEPLRYQLDLCFNEEEDMPKCVELANKILEIKGDDAHSLLVKSIALARIGRSGAAIEILEGLRTKIFGNQEYHCAKSVVLNLSADFSGSLASINEMMEYCGMARLRVKNDDGRFIIDKISCAGDLDYSDGGPLVSVILTTYGRNVLTEVAIDSILNQTHRNLELIIVDDCSEDDNFEHLQKTALKDSRMKVIQTKVNGGTYLAKNLGMGTAVGEYVTFMDSDDWTHPQRLEFQVSAMEEKPELMAVAHSYFRVDEDGGVIFRGTGSMRIGYITTMIRRQEILDRVGYFDSIRVSADAEYIGRIIAIFGDSAFRHDQLPSLIAAHHESSLTGGGSFQIDWRGSSGLRFQHYSSFKAWHLRIQHVGVDGRIAHPLEKRPFEVPKEMIAP